MSVSGQTISWAKVADVNTYVFVQKVSGESDQYSMVNGTTVTPGAVAGKTVTYGLRTAVDGSAWAVEVKISYPAPSPAPDPTPSPTPFGKMIVGLNAGNYGTSGAATDRSAVQFVRMDSGLGASALKQFASAGLRVDIDFAGPYNSSGVSAINASQWVSNTLNFYKSNTDPTTTPMIEVLNEPGGTWFWGGNATSQTNADAYRNLVKATYDAFHAQYGAAAPKILATFDDGSSNMTWGKRWWTSDSKNYVDGVVVHPYGGTDSKTVSALGNRQQVTDAHTYTGLPVYPTEVGWPTALGQAATGDSLQWSESDQAANLTNFMDWARGTGYVGGVMYFNDRDYGTNMWYGVMHADGTKKAAFDALKAESAK